MAQSLEEAIGSTKSMDLAKNVKDQLERQNYKQLCTTKCGERLS